MHLKSARSIRSCAVLAAVAAVVGFAGRADAAVILSLTDIQGDPASTTITPGQSLTLNVTLQSDRPFNGLTFFLSAPGAGSGRFSITGRTTSPSNPLGDPVSSDAQVLAPASALLDPVNNSDLGYSAEDISTNIAAGTYQIGTLTLTSSATITPGVYTIGVTNGVVSDASFTETPVVGGTYSVTVVPEPTGLGLLGVGAVVACLRRRRRC